jgi:dephospho-CoA kinase
MAFILPEIIGIVGPIRAGKTTVAKYLVERYGYISASNSDILRRILVGMGIAPSRANLASLGDSMFEVLGNDIIAKCRLDKLHLGRIVVDGIRYPDELERYSEMPSFKLLGITADPAIRFQRTLRESEELKDLAISKAEFDRFALSRSELNVPELVSIADITISNLGSVENLKDGVDKILDHWSR